jgi:hypothetical protein
MEIDRMRTQGNRKESGNRIRTGWFSLVFSSPLCLGLLLSFIFSFQGCSGGGTEIAGGGTEISGGTVIGQVSSANIKSLEGADVYLRARPLSMRKADSALKRWTRVHTSLK